MDRLGTFSIIEKYLSMTRFKLFAKIPLGEIFGEIEANKARLHLDQYSVKQASIEQIFNDFAKTAAHIED